MTLKTTTAFLIAFSLSLSVAAAVLVPDASAAVSDWQKAGAIQPRWDTDFGSDSFKASVQNLKNAGANSVALVIPYYQSNAWSTDIHRGWNTPTDASLAAGIDYAHSLGLSVSLKPHLESYDGQWRANINPGDRDTWYRNYENMLMDIARLGQAHGAEQLVVGTELISMAAFTSNGDNTQRWQSIIGAVRSVFSGTLLYSANWGSGDFAEEVPHIGFWGSLDYIGISAYYPLSQWGSNDVESLKGSWDFWNNTKIRPISEQYGKPVLFTEIGYRSVSGAHNEPWNSWMGGAYDPQEQVNDYTALFSYWNNHSFMRGGYLWDWSSDPNAGGPGDIGYTPQRKPAEDVIKQWFGSPVPPSGGGTTTPPPSTGTTFSASGSATPSGVTVSQPVSIQATVTAQGAASNVIVDMEVFSSSGEKVHQQFRENESFAANQSKSYTTSFTPAANGTYTATLGVFNSTWSQNFFWGDIATIAVGGAAPPPPPPSGGDTVGDVTICGRPGTDNFNACYYQGQNFETFKMQREDAAVDFDWGAGSPNPVLASDNFSARWLGLFDFESGVYEFTVTSDDGVRLNVDNELILDKWFDQAATTYTVQKTMTASENRGVILEYFENGGNASVTLSWRKITTDGGGTTPPPPPGPATIDVWWPTDGSHITGVQPWKAMIPDRDVDSYTMVWQVDGDIENAMYSTPEGYPHKEALVDVTGWNWKEAGSAYTVTFTAKSGSGSTEATRSVNIFTN